MFCIDGIERKEQSSHIDKKKKDMQKKNGCSTNLEKKRK